MKFLIHPLILLALLTPLGAQSTDHLPTPTAFEQPAEVSFWAADTLPFPGDSVVADLTAAYPKLKVTWQASTVNQFLTRLAAGGQTGARFPDIVFVSTSYLAKAMLDQKARLVIGRPSTPGNGRGSWFIPQSAADPRLSESFVLWLERRVPHPDSDLLTPESKAQIGDAALDAVRAFGSTLKAPADAVLDPAIAAFAWDWTGTRLAGREDQRTFMPEVSGIAGNERLAFAYVTALAAGEDFYGLRRFFVILRRTETAWRVLYLQPETESRAATDISSFELELKNGLQPFTTVLMPISPMQGARIGRRPTPEVTFDQEGEPGFAYGLETQFFDSFLSKWSPSNLTFTPGLDSRVHLLKINATFAPHAQNRWRIWSISKAGTVALTGWQTIETTY